MPPQDQNTTPSINPTPEPVQEEKKPAGPVVAIAIIILLLILGGLYFWGSQLDKQEGAAADIENMEDPTREQLESQSSSDELNAIEADLEASSYENLDAEASSVEGEF